MSVNLFLIGFRGAGKSSVGRLLADRLAWQFVDMDEEIEQIAGCSIRSIFDREGEPGFRQHEAALLRTLAAQSKQVVATGGGVILDEANRTLIQQAGTVVWLTADAETLRQRLHADPQTRARRPPLLPGEADEIDQLLEQRTPLYRQCANLVVDTVGRTPDDVTHWILRSLPRPFELPLDPQCSRSL